MDKFQKIYSTIISEGAGEEEDKLSQYIGMTMVRIPNLKLRPNLSKGVWKSHLKFEKMTIKSIEAGENGGKTRVVCVSPDGRNNLFEVNYINQWLQYMLQPHKPSVYVKFDDDFLDEDENPDMSDFTVIVDLPWVSEKFAPTLEQVAQIVKMCISLERQKAEDLAKMLSEKEAELDTIR